MNEIIRPTDELPVSVLKANHIVFDELSFVRDGFSLKDDSMLAKFQYKHRQMFRQNFQYLINLY